jgi:ABC-type sugar transport system ATPase subunit
MITLENVTIHQGNFSLVGFSLELPVGEYGVLMGPTGCGKTTLMESICGLRAVSNGRILMANQNVTKLSPSQRQIGYVPQHSVLFPAMRVGQQIEFGLEVRKVAKRERRRRARELAELLDIAPLLNRFPKGLSGGERQRVALARALAIRPRLLCLDEPLSALDSRTKIRVAEVLREFHHSEQVSVLHITHDEEEAKRLGTIQFQMDSPDAETE